MNNSEINFDLFVDKFYNNKNSTKMTLELILESNDNINIYDIHVMLLQMFFIGIVKYNIPFNQMQNYFTNINIKVYIQNFTIKQLIEDTSGYSNRYIRINDKMEMIKNGSYNKTQTDTDKAYTDIDKTETDDLISIKSFYTIDNDVNLCIYFDHII